jgi:hypothetical protein
MGKKDTPGMNRKGESIISLVSMSMSPCGYPVVILGEKLWITCGYLVDIPCAQGVDNLNTKDIITYPQAKVNKTGKVKE